MFWISCHATHLYVVVNKAAKINKNCDVEGRSSEDAG